MSFPLQTLSQLLAADASVLGSVVAVENFGAGDILEIEKPEASASWCRCMLGRSRCGPTMA